MGADTQLREPPRDTGPAAGAIAEYTPDPTIGILSGLWGIPSNGFGVSQDQHPDDIRALTATSEPLAEDLLICGRGEVTVHVAAEPPEPVERLVVKLTDVDPLGRSTFIAADVRSPEETVAAYRIPLRATTYRLHAGHRLRVVFSDAAFPRLTPLPAPRPIRVARIELRVPWLRPDASAPTNLPALPDPVPAALAPGRDSPLLIIRNPVNDGVEIRLA